MIFASPPPPHPRSPFVLWDAGLANPFCRELEVVGDCMESNPGILIEPLWVSVLNRFIKQSRTFVSQHVSRELKIDFKVRISSNGLEY